jgi:hypothetical protein
VPAPVLRSNIIEDIQSSDSFAIDLAKDGLVGGSAVHFGFERKAPKYSDYTIVLCPRSEQSVSASSFGIDTFSNKSEYFSIPTSEYRSFLIDPDEDFEKIKEVFTNPLVQSELKRMVTLENYEKLFKTGGKFDDKKIKDFYQANGLPAFYPNTSFGFKNTLDFFGIRGRQDYFISNFDKRPLKTVNDEKITSKKLSSSNTLLMSLKRNYIDPIMIPGVSRYKNLSDLSPVDEQIISVAESQISSDFSKDFRIFIKSEEFEYYNLDTQKEFLAYIYDSYGQLTRVPYGALTVQRDKPSIEFIDPYGFSGSDIILTDDIVDLKIKGDSLLNISAVKFYSSPESISPLATFNVGDSSITVSKNTFGEFNFTLNGTYQNLITANIGPLWIELVNKNGQSSPFDIFSAIQISEFVVELQDKEEVIGPIYATFNEDSVSAPNSSKIPILMTGEANKSAVIKFNSKDKIFGTSDVNCYIAAEVSTGQSEQQIIDIFEDFSFKEDIFVARGISFQGEEKTIVISKSVRYQLGDFRTSFYSATSKSAKLLFPGQEYSKYNFSRLDYLEKPFFIFLNRDIVDFGSSGIDINVENMANSYSLLRLGNDDEPGFTKPPSIRNIIVKNRKDSGILTSNIISEKILKILTGSNKRKKTIFSKEEMTEATIGTEIHTGKEIETMVIIAEGYLPDRSLSEFKLTVGDSNFGFGFFAQLASLFDNSIILSESFVIEEGGVKKTIAVFAMSNVQIKNDGIQNLFLTKKDSAYKTTYDSSLRKIQTVNSYNFSEDEGTITFSGNALLINQNGLFESTSLPLSLNLQDRFYSFSNHCIFIPSSTLGVFGVKHEQDLKITQLKKFFEKGKFLIYGENGKLADGNFLDFAEEGRIGESTQVFNDLKGAFDFSDAQFINVQLPEINLDIDSSSLESLAESSLNVVDTAIGFDAKIDPFSSGANLVNQALGSIEDAVSILADDTNYLVAIDNKSFYFVKGQTKVTRDYYIERDVAPINYDLPVPENAGISVKLYKVFLNVEVKGNALIKVNMPRLTRIVKNSDQNYSVDQFPELTFEVGDEMELHFENLYDEDFKMEVNKKRVSLGDLKITAEGTGTIKYTVSEETGKLDFSVFQSESPCFEISFSSTNSLHFGATKAIGNDLTINLDKRMEELMNGSLLNDKKDQKDWADLGLKFPIKWSAYIADKSQTLLELRDSFCDLSFSITGQFSAYLSGFKNILVIIKVIFCIIDVICALLNPVKLAFATIRLFSCLYDLLLLLPQIAVPVALLTLILHLLELLKCILEKILYIIRAINAISEALEQAILNQDVEAILNLEKVLSEYILDLETDIQVLDPIIDILNLFLELLQIFFAFPCSPGEGSTDEFRECQLDSSLVSGIILSKVTGEAGDGLSKENLLPVAQGYPTLSVDDLYGAIQCGNTPPGTENDNLDWMGDCNYSGDVLREPQDYIGSKVANKNIKGDGFLDRTTVNSKTFRTSNIDGNGEETEFSNVDFEATYSVTYTKSTKNPSNLAEAFIQGPDPRRVTFEFNSKGRTNALGYVPILGLIFRKKIIDINQTLDSPFMFMNRDGNEYKVSDSIEDGAGFYSPIDGFSNFLRGSVSDGFYPRPLTVQFKSDTSDKVWERTFEDLPMLAIVDEQFNVYFINENGIKVDPATGAVLSIEARIISTASAPKNRFSKEDREVVKDELTLAEQANYNWLISLPNAPEPSDGGVFDPFPARIKDAHDIDQARIKELAEAWGDWTDFETEYAEQVPFITSRNKDGEEESAGAYDYAGGFIWDKLKLSEAIDTIDVFDFPRLYFVDMRQVADELQSACTISDINSILLGGPSNEEVANNVNEVLECVGNFRNFMQKKIDGLKESVENGQVPGIIDIEEVEGQYTAFVNCLTDSADKACNIVINPYNTTFMLSEDTEKNVTDYANPNELLEENLEEVLEFAAGLAEEFDGPAITGAAEFASGLGTEVNAKIGEEIEIIIIPRDSYDNLVENLDFEPKINIQIISDTTGSAKLKQYTFEGQTVFAEKTESGDAYRSIISSDYPGKISIKASICGKTIKAFTYSNVVQIEGEEDTVDQADCIPDSTVVGEEVDVSLGALVEVDRVLNINIEDKDVFLGIRKPDLDEVASDPQTNPQTNGTNLEN